MGEILIGVDMRDFHPFVCGNMNNRGIEGGDALGIIENKWFNKNCRLDIK